jgi:hypothetical protein
MLLLSLLTPTLATRAFAQAPANPAEGPAPAPGAAPAPAPAPEAAPAAAQSATAAANDVPPASDIAATEAAANANASGAVVAGPVEPTAPTPAGAGADAVAPGASSQERQLPAWLDYFSIGGGLILYYYQPTSGDGDNNFNVFFANLLLDGKWESFGLHIEPRFRDTPLRSFFTGPAWLQEAYASDTIGPVTVKVGKSYKRLGLFWDNSFYGNVQVYDGLKLDPNYGVSVEGSLGQKEAFGVDFSAQFFIVDGSTNVSLAGRDTLSVPGARRRNAIVGRVAPIYHFGDEGSVQVGVSAEHFTADLPTGEDGVTRFAGEAKATYGTFGAWGEVLVQDGRHVTDFPYAGTTAPAAPGRASGDNRYVLLGAEYGIGPVTLRYNFSYADYHDVDVTEVMHVPAIGLAVNQNLSVLAEYVHWTRDTNEGDVDVDKSLNVTFSGHF